MHRVFAGKRGATGGDGRGGFMSRGRLRALNPKNARAFFGFRGARQKPPLPPEGNHTLTHLELLPSQPLLILNNDSVGGFPVNATEVIERGARSLGGNHAGTDGFFGRAGSAKDFAFPRFNPSGEHRSTFTGGGIGNSHARHVVESLRVPGGEFLGNPHPGVRHPP